MGTWGVKIFENDSASDLIIELEDEKDLSIIVVKLAEIVEEYNKSKDEIIEYDLAAQALVACEIVAAILNKPCSDFPTEIGKWLKKKKSPDRNIISLFNGIMKEVQLEGDINVVWKKYTKEQKWEYILHYLKTISVEAIEIVANNSELKELWQESNEYNKWAETIADLKLRLSG